MYLWFILALILLSWSKHGLNRGLQMVDTQYPKKSLNVDMNGVYVISINYTYQSVTVG